MNRPWARPGVLPPMTPVSGTSVPAHAGSGERATMKVMGKRASTSVPPRLHPASITNRTPATTAGNPTNPYRLLCPLPASIAAMRAAHEDEPPNRQPSPAPAAPAPAADPLNNSGSAAKFQRPTSARKAPPRVPQPQQ